MVVVLLHPALAVILTRATIMGLATMCGCAAAGTAPGSGTAAPTSSSSSCATAAAPPQQAAATLAAGGMGWLCRLRGATTGTCWVSSSCSSRQVAAGAWAALDLLHTAPPHLRSSNQASAAAARSAIAAALCWVQAYMSWGSAPARSAAAPPAAAPPAVRLSGSQAQATASCRHWLCLNCSHRHHSNSMVRLTVHHHHPICVRGLHRSCSSNNSSSRLKHQAAGLVLAP